MPKKIRIGLIAGGQSGEHEVSLQSAHSIIDALNQKKKYKINVIGIAKDGRWLIYPDLNFLLYSDDPKRIRLKPNGQPIALAKGDKPGQAKIINLKTKDAIKIIDLALPILHGPLGEDGTIQGFLKLLNIPFIGSSVIGSALGMDKEIMKRLLAQAGLPIAKFLTWSESDKKLNFAKVKKILGAPVFVKPANLGSSVGVSKAKNEAEFKQAVKIAFDYDRKIIIEENIRGREIECAVLGNQKPIASLPGEVAPNRDFYSYQAKYLDANGATLKIPADLPSNLTKEIQALAIKTFKTLQTEGLGRVDFFLKANGKIIINEINTMPGFTRISMYPKLWAVSGWSYSKLIDRLIELALERFKQEQKLQTNFSL